MGQVISQLFHQNASSLHKQFQRTSSQARDILLFCPSCHGVAPAPLAEGTNPQGLTTNSIWQTDVTHIPGFGYLKYLHISIDTYSHFLMVTAHTREKARDAIQHWLTCFATLALPDTIKLDHGPAYTSESVHNFLQQWSVPHNTGIPRSLTGSTIVKCAHRTLKTMLEKQKGVDLECPYDRLAKCPHFLKSG